MLINQVGPMGIEIGIFVTSIVFGGVFIGMGVVCAIFEGLASFGEEDYDESDDDTQREILAKLSPMERERRLAEEEKAAESSRSDISCGDIIIFGICIIIAGAIASFSLLIANGFSPAFGCITFLCCCLFCGGWLIIEEIKKTGILVGVTGIVPLIFILFIK